MIHIDPNLLQPMYLNDYQLEEVLSNLNNRSTFIVINVHQFEAIEFQSIEIYFNLNQLTIYYKSVSLIIYVEVTITSAMTLVISTVND